MSSQPAYCLQAITRFAWSLLTKVAVLEKVGLSHSTSTARKSARARLTPRLRWFSQPTTAAMSASIRVHRYLKTTGRVGTSFPAESRESRSQLPMRHKASITSSRPKMLFGLRCRGSDFKKLAADCADYTDLGGLFLLKSA